jgi:hypothetical protein
MELELIKGCFTKEDAEQIISDIFQVKIDFHHKKIRSFYQAEEDIAHAEKRITELEDTKRYVLSRIRNHKKDKVDVHAHLELSLAAPLTL